jgi:pimeloyl-ACP methyl ester carboxylesterase
MTDCDRKSLLQAMQSLSTEAVSRRLSLLSQFQFNADPIRQSKHPTLILASEADRLLPSPIEARRLQSLLPQAQIQCLPGSGHACLLETQLNLAQILKENQFLPQKALISA